ncbi:Calx-beta domain-containing protein [Phragmitibacter flavus]|nr:Calx-beta domain-containing protein [Phragmitibacter flavus]
MIMAVWWNLDGSEGPEPDQSLATAPRSGENVSEERPETLNQPGSASFGARGEVPWTKVTVTPLPDGARDDVRAFREWAMRYAQATVAERAGLVEEGRVLAKAHRAALKAMLVDDPRAALEQALPMVLRQQLPQEVVRLLEERLSGVGTFDVLAVSPGSDPSEPPIRRVAILDGRYFQAYTYGQRSGQMSTEGAMLNGIAVDNLMAVNDSPVRALEVGEVPDAAKEAVEVCPVSEITTKVERGAGESLPAITEETPAIEAGDQIIYLCDGGHIRQIEEDQLAAEGATGGPTATTGYFPISRLNSTGIRKILYMRVVFPDRMEEAQTERDAYNNLRSLTDYFQESSYGKLTFMGTVTPLIVTPRTAAWYIEDFKTAGASYAMIDDAKEVARSLGFPPEDYDHFVVMYFGGPGNFGGQGNVNGPRTWLKSTSVGVLNHEVGHNIGVWHSNSWNTAGSSVIGPGANVEYGHTNDVMGSSSSGGHFNASMKEQLQWIVPENYHTVLQSGTYRLFQFDQVNQDPAKRYALRVAKDADRDYWLEFRQKLTANPWYFNGVSINWSPWGVNNSTSKQGSNRGTQLLDMTPGSADDRNDSPLTMGRTFSDYEADVHVTPIGKAGTVPQSMDVVVNRGTMAAGNQPPTLSISANALTIAVGGTVNFSATASDPDGDVLAYFWEFGDKLSSYHGSSFSMDNLPAQTKTYATAGYYTARCTASDMKGGAVTKTLLVRVGNPTTYTLSGTVMMGGNPLPGVRVHNGLTAANYRGAMTDADGFYQITNVAAGTVTLSASLAGYTMTAGFINPVSVFGNMTNLEFTGTLGTRVSLSTIAEVATEGGTAGVFRLARTGGTTQSLTVYVDFSGQATTADFTMSPVADTTVSPLESFVIPAGASFLDITVAATNDTAQEGAETLVISLINGSNSYLATGPQTVTMMIDDNDTTKPRVNIELVDAEATENDAGDTASFRFTRTGDTTNPLMVNYAIGSGAGFATPGVDYESILVSVIIPAEASSVLRAITPINDNLVEGMELVTLTVTSSVNYVLPSPAPTATIKLIDEDTPVVTIAATDASANENGDPGLFTISRTGDLSAPLLVHYAVGGSALHGTDYVALPGFVNFAAGVGSVTVPVIPYQDDHGEPTQNVILQLRSANTYQVGVQGQATVSILDDGDVRVVTVGVSDGVVSEGVTPGTGKFKFTSTGSGSGNVTVNYTISGTAQSGVDFVALPGSISLGANATAEITVTPINNDTAEDAETVVLTIQPSPGYLVDLQNSATMVILDDDSGSMVSVSAAAPSVTENSSSSFYISRPSASGAALSVAYSVTGTATPGLDYDELSGTATIPVDAAGVFVDVDTNPDASAEGVETVVLTILPDVQAPRRYGIQTGSATLKIVDDDFGFVSQVSFAQPNSVVSEDAGEVVITVNRVQPVGACTVEYGVQSGTALGHGVDFWLPQGVLSFADGETSKSFVIQIVDDVVPEEMETVAVQLRHASGTLISSVKSQHVLFIRDNEPRVRVEATDPFAYEGETDKGLLTFIRQGSTGRALVVPIGVSGTATSGTDFVALPASVTIPAGQSSTTLSVTGLADALAEVPETIVVSLGGVAPGLPGVGSSAVIDLGDGTNNDPPFVRIVSPQGISPGVPAGMGLMLRALHADDGPLEDVELVWSKVSGPGTVMFTYPNEATTGATFSAEGVYSLRLTANDGLGTGQATVGVTVGTVVQPWANVDLGSSQEKSGAMSQDGLHVFGGTGTSLGGTSDTHFFRYRRLVGNGEIVARIRQVQNTNTSARVGVAIRETTASGARCVMLTVGPNASGQSNLHSRSTTGGNLLNITASTGIYPGYWVKVTRVGNAFSVFRSPDGLVWTQQGGSQTVAMGASAFAGMVVTSNTAGFNHALVDNVRILGAPENHGPLMGPVVSPSVASTQIPHLMGATLADDDQPGWPGTVSYAWTQTGGPVAAVFEDPSVLNAKVTMAQAGSYQFQLNGDDGEVETYVPFEVTVTKPVVNLNVLASNAAEFGPQVGSFTVSRTGATGGPLVVPAAVSGTAQAGADYEAIPPTVIIPTGASSAVVNVLPIRDSVAEGAETVTMSLLSDAAYDLGAGSSGTVTIEDLPFDQWRVVEFGSVDAANDPAIGGSVDFDNDGLDTVLEYALGLDPATAGTWGRPIFEVDGNTCSLTYRRVIAAVDLIYEAQFSMTLDSESWSDEGIVEEELADDGMVKTIKASKVFASPQERCFMRLMVTRQ